MQDTANPNDPATIVASIDLDTVEGHNLRALLLRLSDCESWRVGEWKAAVALGLMDSGVLTPLGRKVAELLRPKPWQVQTHRFLSDSKDSYIVEQPGGRSIGLAWARVDAENIAALLTADDLARAKTYKTEAPDHG